MPINDTTTYCVRRIRYAHNSVIVGGLQTIDEALECALKLYALQYNVGGVEYEFCVETE